MAPSYKQNTAKIGEIHGTVNLRFKRPVHEAYTGGGCTGVTVEAALAKGRSLCTLRRGN